jgi:hypothetical protein
MLTVKHQLFRSLQVDLDFQQPRDASRVALPEGFQPLLEHGVSP